MGNHYVGSFDDDRISKALSGLCGGATYTGTDPTSDDLRKSSTPPAGFHPIPGGKHEGYTNGKTGRSRRYWYPHDADMDGAENHHRAEAHRIQQEHRGRMTPSGYPKDKAAKQELENHHHAAFAIRDGEYRSGRAPKKAKPASDNAVPAKLAAHLSSLKEHLNHGRGGVNADALPPLSEVEADLTAAVAFGKQRGNKTKMLKQLRELQGAARDSAGKADRKGPSHDHTLDVRNIRDAITDAISTLAARAKPKPKPSAASTSNPSTGSARGGASAGKHRLADRNGHREVDSAHSAGHYHVHDSGQKGSRRYGVTHGPTGVSLGSHGSKAAAKRMADHFHANAPDAGKDASFGNASTISSGDMDKLRGAMGSFRKSLVGGPDQFDLQMGSIIYHDYDITGSAPPVVKSMRPHGQPARPLDALEWGHLWDQE